jgi:hypothetical protein
MSGGGGGRRRGPLDFDDDEDDDRTPAEGAPAEEAGARPRISPVHVPRGPVWFLGAAGVVLLAVVLVNAISGGGREPGLTEGDRLPEFAAPLASSTFPAGRDAVELGEGKRAACALRGPQVLNLCELRRRGPVVLAFFAAEGRACLGQLDVLERVAARFPRVAAAAVAVRAERAEVAPLVRARGWRLPVAYDADGRLAARYRVVTCPQLVFARRGGAVVQTTFRALDERELTPLLRSLAQGR